MTLLAALALGSLLTLGTAVNAQDASTNSPAAAMPAAGRNRQPSIDDLIAKLGITDDQKTNFTAIITDMRKQMKDLRADDTLSTEDRRAKMKTIRDDGNTKLKALLTPDQFAKYQKLMPGRRPAAPAPAAN